MLFRTITPVYAAATLVVLQTIAYESGGTQCNLVIPSMLTSSGIDASDVVRCSDLTNSPVKFASRCPSESRNVMFCTWPIIIRHNPRNASTNVSDSWSGSKESFYECVTYEKGKCMREFNLIVEGKISEIPDRLDIRFIHPAISNEISSITLVNCDTRYVTDAVCFWETEMEILRPSSDLEDLLKNYVLLTDNERKITIKVTIVRNSCRLERQMISFGFNFVDHLTFNSSLEDMISYSVFASIPHVEIVILENLTLNHLPPALFESNKNLSICAITQCMLEDVDPELFASNTALEAVDLSSNKLQTLPESLFHKNVRLRLLSLAQNQIRHLPENFLVQNNDLRTLDLSHNLMKQLQLAVMTNPPQTTYANFNGTRSITPGLDRRFRSWLKGETRSVEIFNATIKTNTLEVIDVSYNHLEKIPDGLFDGSIILTILTADHNDKLKHLLGSHSFYALEEFSFADCNIRNIDEDFFAKQNENRPLFVNKIDLSRNQLSALPTRTFWNCNELVVLLLRRNRLFELQSGLFKHLSNLKLLDVSGNMLSTFQAESFNLRNIVYLNFSWNHIEVFDVEKMLSLFEDSTSFMKIVDIYQNCMTSKRIRLPSVSEKQRLYFKYVRVRYTPLKLGDTVQDGSGIVLSTDEIGGTNKGRFNYEYGRNHIQQLSLGMKVGPTGEGITLCPNPFKQFCSHFPLACGHATVAKRQAIEEKFRNLNFAECEEVTFQDNSTEDAIECPFKPSCQASHYRAILRMNTGFYDKDSSFTCPVNTSCPTPCTCYSRAIENEVVVNCSHKRLSHLPRYSPPDTKVLYFDHNELRALIGLNSSAWSSLTELYLQNNFISSISKSDLPPTLKLISLRNNKIEGINKTDLDVLNDIEFFLSGNPWKCDCNALLLKAMLSATNSVVDSNAMLCATSNTSILNTPNDVLCPVKLPAVLEVPLAVILGIILPLLAGILIFLYYRNKELVHAYMFAKFHFVFGFSRSPRDLGAGNSFDAFVAYSSDDREVVVQMVEELERKEPYFRLCIQERDWLLGDLITTNIAKSVSLSRKTIFVLSDDFIRSEWIPLVFLALYDEMVHDKNYAMVIIKGDIPHMEELNGHLQCLLQSSTHLIWGERWFWEKLRYALYKKAHNVCPLAEWYTK